jgi:hypothetical protein
MVPWARRALLGALLAACALLAAPAPAAPPVRDDGPKSGDPGKAADKAKAEPPVLEVRFTDGGVMKLTLREEKIELKTDYGKLLIPVAEVREIEFATRLPDADAKKIAAAIARLAKEDFQEREAATAELLKFGARAYPALLTAAKSDDPEVRKRAEELLSKVREAVPEEDLEVRPHDVVHTEHSKIAGKIEAASFKARTAQFGDVEMKLSDVRALRGPGAGEPDANGKLTAQPDPGTLTGFQGFIGKKFAFTVTGRVGGVVYGTDVYTTDSLLATAAVHAGVLRPGQTGTVRVLIVASPPAFIASTRNGVTSNPWTVYPAAYQILKK